MSATVDPVKGLPDQDFTEEQIHLIPIVIWTNNR